MRRHSIRLSAVVALVAVIALAVPAGAAVRHFNGTATATFRPNTGRACPGNGRIGSVTGSLARPRQPTWMFDAPKVCFAILGHEAQFMGEARLLAPDHSLVHARLTGTWDDVEGVITAWLYFKIHGGTGEFVHATGLIRAGPGTLDASTGKYTAPTTGSIKT